MAKKSDDSGSDDKKADGQDLDERGPKTKDSKVAPKNSPAKKTKRPKAVPKPHLARKVGKPKTPEGAAKDKRLRDILSLFNRPKGQNVDYGALQKIMLGYHSDLQDQAAGLIGLGLGYDPTLIEVAIASYNNDFGNRFELKGAAFGATVLHDFAHLPREIIPTIENVLKRYPGRRLMVAFQPHRYSRTKELCLELATAFNRADLLLLVDVYPVGETPSQGMDSLQLAEAIRAQGHKAVEYVGKLEDLPTRAMTLLKPKDLFLTIGAGDINKAADDLLAMSWEREPD
ncbi:MAG: hypothetical protein LBT38_03440 [Deltaproteobacteria bacterium]|jgi:UDP-N-acetylmuramate-alanine ligase|nr:hypothetical protein [Deltaproteobacteria bacterium]